MSPISQIIELSTGDLQKLQEAILGEIKRRQDLTNAVPGAEPAEENVLPMTLRKPEADPAEPDRKKPSPRRRAA